MRVKRCCGMLPTVMHAAPEYVIAGNPVPVSAACRIYGENSPEYLFLHVEGNTDYKMLPCDRYERKGIAYMIYRADIPASAVNGDILAYRIDTESEKKSSDQPYVCKIKKVEDIPALPALAITEIFARPKGREHTAYFELFNPTAGEVDLYDYELLIYGNTAAPDFAAVGDPKGRIPLANGAGENILGAGEYAAIWGLNEKNFLPEINATTRDDFIREINSIYFYQKAPIDESKVKVFPVDLTEIDPETGARKKLSGVCSLPNGHNATTLVIVPRGEDAASAVFTLVYSDHYAEWDTPVSRSSYWRIDPLDPRKAVNITHADFATPGYNADCQPKHIDLTAPLPVILPLAPIEEAYHGDRICTVEFVVLPSDPATDISHAGISVALHNGEKLHVEAKEEHDGVHRARISEDVFEDLSLLEYEILASDGSRSVCLGNYLPLTVPVYDNRGPRIISMLPTRGYAYDAGKPIVIEARYTDPAGLRIRDCYLKIDGKDVTGEATISASLLRYEPKKPLEVGEHTLTLRLKDGLGNRTTRTVPFSVSDMSDLSVYFGEVHAHTGESDGNGLCSDALQFAYDSGADFFSVTEHSHYLPAESYEKQKKVADSFNRPGRFAALYGWEMTWNNTCGYWGHMNVIGSKDIISDIHGTSMPDLFEWLGKDCEAVGMFNHPGSSWGDFEDYGYRTETADRSMCLAEIKGRGYDLPYMMLLARGWHVAPSFNEDNHAPNWTVASPYITGVLAPALTRENIMQAFRDRRVYSSCDPTMKIFYKINGEWMGSRINSPSELNVSVKITTENENGIGRIEIVGEDNIVVATKIVGARQAYEWSIALPVEFDYYYLRVSNGAQYSVTAPVWIENRGEPKILSMLRSASYDDRESAAVTLKIENPTDKTMSEVRVDFYLSGVEGFVFKDAVPYCKAYIGNLKPGRSIKVSRQIPEIAKMRRVTAVVSAMSEKSVKKSTAFIRVSPVSITEVLCATDSIFVDGEELKNPFPYVTLCNNSGKEISLSDGKLALWTLTGKPPQETRIWDAKSVKIAPRSTAVIWYRRPEYEMLTVDDFNNRYATAFVEGEDIFVCDRPIISTDAAGRRLDLTIGGEVVSRVTWNMGLRHGHMAEVGQAYKYRFSCDMSPKGVFDGVGIPTPGIVDYKQMGTRSVIEPTGKERKAEKKQLKKDTKRAKHRSQLKYTTLETGAFAAGSAAVAAAIAATAAATIAKAIAKKKK